MIKRWDALKDAVYNEIPYGKIVTANVIVMNCLSYLENNLSKCYLWNIDPK